MFIALSLLGVAVVGMGVMKVVKDRRITHFHHNDA